MYAGWGISMVLPDYSTWLTPERLEIEERLWEGGLRTWPTFVAAIERVQSAAAIRSVIEFGCGTGWVGAALPQLAYTGVDANAGCIAAAQQRNPGAQFIRSDIRTVVAPAKDLACAFSVLKHFGLLEWDAILGTILGHGVHGLFSMRVGSENTDDGTEFPHVQVTSARLESAVSAAGHAIQWTEALPWGEVMIATKASVAQLDRARRS